jgi:hypothetical protein
LGKYHPTRSKDIKSIVENGPLNYTDQQKVLGNTLRGLPQLNPGYRGDEKKGVLLGARDFALEKCADSWRHVREDCPSA